MPYKDATSSFREYAASDVIVQDANGNPLVISQAQPFVFRLTTIGKLRVLEIECQLSFNANTNFFQFFLPPEFNAKDQNPVGLLQIPGVSVGAVAAMPNVVDPTAASGNNPVTLFVSRQDGAQFVANVVDFFGTFIYSIP